MLSDLLAICMNLDKCVKILSSSDISSIHTQFYFNNLSKSDIGSNIFISECTILMSHSCISYSNCRKMVY